jgi:Phosphotransferase enzyme family
MAEGPLERRPRDADLPEERRNDLLRRVDWRFLLRCPDPPRVIDLAPGWDSEALRLVSGPAGPGEADVALVGFPGRSSLRAARNALAPGGEVVCRWRTPRLAGVQRAKRRLARAGFVDARPYWAGPQPDRLPQFWLHLDSPEATNHMLTARPARSLAGSVLRRLWHRLARIGSLSPVYVIARLPGRDDGGVGERPPILLTGGRRSVNKVVALSFAPGRAKPREAVKFARIAEAEAGLEREGAVLARLARERPVVEGIPVFHGRLARCGRLGIAEGAMQGDSMLDRLTPKSFAEMARRVGGLLIELAGGSDRDPRSRTTVGEHLSFFSDEFGPLVGESGLAVLQAASEVVAGLPVVCEHRDCSPWNLVLADRDRPALLDWESAEPDGLPGLDLVYFLANAAFVLDGAIEGGTTRESYRRLLDPATPYGAVAAAVTARYGEALGLDPEAMPALRLICWMVHCRSDHEHLRLEAAREPTPDELARAPFLGLLLEELERAAS